MSIFPHSTCKWIKGAGATAVVTLGILTFGQADSIAPGGQKPVVPDFLPFLDVFRAKEPEIVERLVRFPSAAGEVSGHLARQAKSEALPAVILLHDERGLSAWMKENARDLAGIGFVVLALDLEKHVPAPGKSLDPAQVLDDEALLAKLSAAVRWLRRQNEVQPGHLGVVGWSCGGSQALALAAATPLQACVYCYCPLSTRADFLAGLHGAALLGIHADKDAGRDAFQKSLNEAHIPHRILSFAGTRPGFMATALPDAYAFEPAEKAWYEIYEFLGKYVEDAQENSLVKVANLSPLKGKTPATIADVMRAMNDPRGLRGGLMEALAEKPADDKAWARIRAQAAVLAEANRLLQAQTPPRGSRAHWLDEIHVFTSLAESVVRAADEQDYTAARKSLTELSERCAVCHKKHR